MGCDLVIFNTMFRLLLNKFHLAFKSDRYTDRPQNIDRNKDVDDAEFTSGNRIRTTKMCIHCPAGVYWSGDVLR